MSERELTTLGLNLPSDPRWSRLAEMELEEILTDHAYCEMKAATSCISLIQSYSDLQLLIEELMPIVSEEWGHFRQVVKKMYGYGFKLGRQRKDVYVNELLKLQRKGGDQRKRLMDRLLICGLIEARSCERFRLLSKELSDPELQKFYHHFMVSEAGHYRTFLRLAKHYCGKKQTMDRWGEMLKLESEIIRKMPVRGDRMH